MERNIKRIVGDSLYFTREVILRGQIYLNDRNEMTFEKWH